MLYPHGIGRCSLVGGIGEYFTFQLDKSTKGRTTLLDISNVMGTMKDRPITMIPNYICAKVELATCFSCVF